jgi:hypothetical protein
VIVMDYRSTGGMKRGELCEFICRSLLLYELLKFCGFNDVY